MVHPAVRALLVHKYNSPKESMLGGWSSGLVFRLVMLVGLLCNLTAGGLVTSYNGDAQSGLPGLCQGQRVGLVGPFPLGVGPNSGWVLLLERDHLPPPLYLLPWPGLLPLMKRDYCKEPN